MLARVSSIRSVVIQVDDRSEVSSFARGVLDLLERTEYRRCDKGEDLEDIYRLRYKAYRSNDMVPDSENHVDQR